MENGPEQANPQSEFDPVTVENERRNAIFDWIVADREDTYPDENWFILDESVARTDPAICTNCHELSTEIPHEDPLNCGRCGNTGPDSIVLCDMNYFTEHFVEIARANPELIENSWRQTT